MTAWADSAAVATMQARIVSLADSTSTLAAHLDSLIAATPDTLRDTLWVGLVASPESGAAKAAPWIGYAIAASIAVIAGIVAQWFRVSLDRRVTKRHLIQQVDHDLGKMGWLLEELRKENQKSGGVPWEIQGQLDFVLASYKSYQDQLAILPWHLRKRVATAFLEVAGVREVLRLVSERNTRAREGKDKPMPDEQVAEIYATFSRLRMLCRNAEVAARAEIAAQDSVWFWLRRRRVLGWWFLWRQSVRQRREERVGVTLDDMFTYRQTGKLPYGDGYVGEEAKGDAEV